jgi:G3E family GTPase
VRIPVTVVHGWLDSGAGELAAGLAERAGPGVALVHPASTPPEPASGVERVAVREQVGHRSPGCPCCALRVDLVDALGRLTRRRVPPARIVVVELPGADAATTVVTLLEDPALHRSLRLDGVVVCLDGPATATAVATHGTTGAWPHDSLLDAVLLADHVWVGGVDRLTHEGIRSVALGVRGLNPLAPVDATAPDHRTMLAIRAWSHAGVAARLDRMCALPHPSAQHPDDGTGGDGTTGSTLLEVDGALDPDRVEDWLDTLHGTVGARLLRIEGVLALDGEDRPRHVLGCRTAFSQQRGPRWRPGQARRSRLRLAGRSLDVGDLAVHLRACRA